MIPQPHYHYTIPIQEIPKKIWRKLKRESEADEYLREVQELIREYDSDE
jgi:hypothetical protein